MLQGTRNVTQTHRETEMVLTTSVVSVTVTVTVSETARRTDGGGNPGLGVNPGGGKLVLGDGKGGG